MTDPRRKKETQPKQSNSPMNKKRKIDNKVSKKGLQNVVAEKSLAELLISRKPDSSLSELVLQMYPNLDDCLKNLDRCLTMVHLFAALPAVESKHIDVKCIQRCRRLSHEWQAYVSTTNSLREAHIQKRGTFYEVDIRRHTISYVTPHPLQQVCTDDFKVILMFLDFYEILLRFVLNTLYSLTPVEYSLACDSDLEVFETDHALSNYIAGKVWMLTVESDLRLAQLQFALSEFVRQFVEGASGKDKGDYETRECRNLFKDLKIFLSGEVPKESLLFVISAFGGVVSWDGGPFAESESSITHQICDRPTKTVASRVCVQTRWVYNCVNRRMVLPTEEYLVGRVPPPPFVPKKLIGDVPENANDVPDSSF